MTCKSIVSIGVLKSTADNQSIDNSGKGGTKPMLNDSEFWIDNNDTYGIVGMLADEPALNATDRPFEKGLQIGVLFIFYYFNLFASIFRCLILLGILSPALTVNSFCFILVILAILLWYLV